LSTGPLAATALATGPTPLGWALLVYLGVLVTFFGFGVWFWGLRALPAARAGALMRQHPLEHLAQAGPRLVGMGFRQMKMQCGSEPTVGASVERVRVMRESIGEDVDLMCDINQLWSVPHAVEVGKRIEPYHLFWLEDPVAHDDYPGLARVADALAWLGNSTIQTM